MGKKTVKMFFFGKEENESLVYSNMVASFYKIFRSSIEQTHDFKTNDY